MVQPGLEEIASEEIAAKLDGDVKRTGKGLVVFRVPEIDEGLLRLRTTEDVFLLAWGTDELTYRAEDLERIRRWTAHDADWGRLLRIHHVEQTVLFFDLLRSRVDEIGGVAADEVRIGMRAGR